MLIRSAPRVCARFRPRSVHGGKFELLRWLRAALITVVAPDAGPERRHARSVDAVRPPLHDPLLSHPYCLPRPPPYVLSSRSTTPSDSPRSHPLLNPVRPDARYPNLLSERNASPLPPPHHRSPPRRPSPHHLVPLLPPSPPPPSRRRSSLPLPPPRPPDLLLPLFPPSPLSPPPSLHPPPLHNPTPHPPPYIP